MWEIEYYNNINKINMNNIIYRNFDLINFLNNFLVNNH